MKIYSINNANQPNFKSAYYDEASKSLIVNLTNGIASGRFLCGMKQIGQSSAIFQIESMVKNISGKTKSKHNLDKIRKLFIEAQTELLSPYPKYHKPLSRAEQKEIKTIAKNGKPEYQRFGSIQEFRLSINS